MCPHLLGYPVLTLFSNINLALNLPPVGNLKPIRAFDFSYFSIRLYFLFHLYFLIWFILLIWYISLIYINILCIKMYFIFILFLFVYLPLLFMIYFEFTGKNNLTNKMAYLLIY